MTNIAAMKEIRESVGGGTLDRLHEYVALLGKWRKVTNLIAEESFNVIWERHILDALNLQRQQPNAICWLDIGSGAGLPGVIIAIVLADRPGTQIHCVEIDRRKCSFLREVAAQLAVPIKIHNTLAERLDASEMRGIEIVTARAFSSVERILSLAAPFLSDGAMVLIPRGRQACDEVAGLDLDRYTVVVKNNPSPGEGFFVQIELRAPPSL